MYEEFRLNVKDTSIMGYHWRVENPSHVVVLIHGIGEYAGRYDRVAEFFKEAKIAMIGMDLRGHGCSAGKRGHTSPRRTILNDMDSLLEYAEVNYPTAPILMYGHSMGGNLALDYRKRGSLADKPVGYLVTAPWVILEKNISNHLFLFVKLMSKMKSDFQISSEVHSALLGNAEIILNQPNKQLSHGKITVGTAMDCFEVGEALLKGKSKKWSKKTNKPLLLMHGTEDRICSIEGSRKIEKVEGITCEYMEWAGLFHEIHNGNATEDGEPVIVAMIKWIKSF